MVKSTAFNSKAFPAMDNSLLLLTLMVDALDSNKSEELFETRLRSTFTSMVTPSSTTLSQVILLTESFAVSDEVSVAFLRIKSS